MRAHDYVMGAGVWLRRVNSKVGGYFTNLDSRSEIRRRDGMYLYDRSGLNRTGYDLIYGGSSVWFFAPTPFFCSGQDTKHEKNKETQDDVNHPTGHDGNK